jgi:hypothetical protein
VGDRPDEAAFRPLTLDEIAGLTEGFSNSDLPCKVDLVDWHNIEDRWRQVIVAERVALTEAAHPDGPDKRGMRGRTEMDLEGGCVCGAVRYRLTAPPLIVHACHCRDCQKQTGSAFVLNMWIENCVEADHSLPSSVLIFHRTFSHF